MRQNSLPSISTLAVIALICCGNFSINVATGPSTIYNTAPKGEPIKDYILPILGILLSVGGAGGIAKLLNSRKPR